MNLLVSLLLTIAAQAGNELGNGGDRISQEFVRIGREMVEQIRTSPDPRIPNPEAIAQAIAHTTVVTKDRVELNGVELDATNHPAEKRIEVSRVRWQDYTIAEKRSLVLHE